MTTLTQSAKQQKKQARAAFIDAAWAGAPADRLAELASASGLEPAAADAILVRIAEAHGDVTEAANVVQLRRAASKAQTHHDATSARTAAAIEKLEAEADAAAFDSDAARRALHDAEAAARRVLAVYGEGLVPPAHLPEEVLALIARRKPEHKAAEAQSAMIAATNERNRIRDHVHQLEAELRDLPLRVIASSGRHGFNENSTVPARTWRLPRPACPRPNGPCQGEKGAVVAPSAQCPRGGRWARVMVPMPIAPQRGPNCAGPASSP